MKNILTLLMLLALTIGASAQFANIGFEGEDALAGWNLFANGSGTVDDFAIADNPDMSGINSSAKCVKFVVAADADPWAGAWSDDFGPYSITQADHILTMMVYKTIISPSCLKVEASADGGTNTELKVSNTVINAWEQLSFDFTSQIGYSFQRLVFFPDFPDTRTGGTTVYIDNISGTGATSIQKLPAVSISIFPNPADEIMFVQAPDMTGYAITNMIGQTIRMEKFQAVSSRSVELSNMTPGVYFITIESLNGSHTSKFMVK
mgnify:CR=1 FL=1